VYVCVCVVQSGESEPLDLGLPISNLDGLRVVLDIAENAPGKGKEQTCTQQSMCAVVLLLTESSAVVYFVSVSLHCPQLPLRVTLRPLRAETNQQQ